MPVSVRAVPGRRNMPRVDQPMQGGTAFHSELSVRLSSGLKSGETHRLYVSLDEHRKPCGLGKRFKGFTNGFHC